MKFVTRLLSLLLPAVLQAGLVFDHDPLEINPKPEDEEVESTFTFKNTGDKPIRVTGLESSCSCLEASLDKAVYEPGEKGTGKAKFKISSFVGRHEKFLHIYTDDPKDNDIVMRAVIDVPALIEIEPKLLQWTQGENAQTKEYTVKIFGSDPMKITGVSSTRESFGAEVKVVKPGREYRLVVKPTTTENIVVGALKIETDSKIPKYQRQMAYFNVVRPELAEKKAKANP